MLNLRKCFSVVLTLAIILGTLTVLGSISALATSGEFATQHMEVDFNNYVLNNTKDKGNTRNGVYASGDGITFSIDGTADKYLRFSLSDEHLNRYYFSDRACIINPTGATAIPTGEVTSDIAYSLEEGARYRVTFDYQVSKAEGATGDVYVWVYSNTSNAITSSSIGSSTPTEGKTVLNNAVASQNKAGWYTATAEIVGPTNTTGKSSLAFSFVTARTTQANNATSSADTNFAYDVCVDNVVADRLGTAVLHYADETEETVYGVPESTAANMRLKGDGVTPNPVYSTTSAQKVPLASDCAWFTDSAHTQPIADIQSVDFLPAITDYYAGEDSNQMETQHMDVSFSDYVVNNTKNLGNTRFGVANDGVSISIDGSQDKYLHFEVSDAYLGRYFYSDRSFVVNPTGGTTADTSYTVKEDGRYRITFDYQVDKATGTGDVYAWVYANKRYPISNLSVTQTQESKQELRKIKLDSSTASSKHGWYTATAEFILSDEFENDKDICSLAIAFLTSMTNQQNESCELSAENNFPYAVNIDNIIVDRLGTVKFVYPDGREDSSYGIPASTAGNKSAESTAYTTSNVSETRGLPLGNYRWYTDENRTQAAASTVTYAAKTTTLYANSTRRFDTNNDDVIDIRDLVKTKKYIVASASYINNDALGGFDSFNATYLTGQITFLLGIGVDTNNPFEVYDLQLEFVEDFNDADLDTTVWASANGTYSTHISSLRTSDDQYLKNGYLNLAISKQASPWVAVKNDTTYSGYFRTGSISSVSKFGYGYYEASYKYPVGSSALCNNSFWLTNGSNADAPTEIDINEGRMPSTVFTNLHAGNTYPATYLQEIDLSADFHRYGLLWTEDVIKWYLDGVCIRTLDVSDKSLSTEDDMTIKLSLALMKIDNTEVTSAYYADYAEEFDELAGESMQVDYVRYYSINN